MKTNEHKASEAPAAETVIVEATEASGSSETKAIDPKVLSQLVARVTDDGSKIGSFIAKLKRDFNKVSQDLDVAIASCVVHIIKHGNVTVARQLLDACPDNLVRKNAIRSYFLAKSPMRWGYKGETATDGEDKTFHLVKDRMPAFKSDFKKDALAFTSDLISNPFHRFSVEGEFQAFDLDKALKDLLKRAEGATKRETDALAKKRKVVGKTNVNNIDKLKKLVKAIGD